MVKQKTPARKPLRTPPITNFFPRSQNNTNSDSSNKHDNENYLCKSTPLSKKSIKKDYESLKRKTTETPFKSHNATESKSFSTIPDSPLKNLQVNNQNTILISDDDDDDDDDDDVSKSVPDVIEEDEVDRLLSKSEKSSKNTKSNLRRSTRSRRVVFQEGFVPTVNAVPTKGDIPIFDDSSSSSTKENYTAKLPYQNSLPYLLREKKNRDKAGYNINALEKTLDTIDQFEDPYDSYDQLKMSAAILNEDAKFEHMQQIFEETDKFDQGYQIEFFETLNSNPQIPNLQTVVLNSESTFDLLLKMYSDKEKLKDILCNNWIACRFEIVPTEVIIWLLHLVSYEEDKIISEASFNTLKNIAEGIYSSNFRSEPDGINVSFMEIYNILNTLGASKQMTSSRYCLEQIIMPIPLLETPPKFSHIDNVRQLLKILVPMISNRLITFSSPEEIRSAIIVFLRLPLDKRLSSLSKEIEQILGSLLEMFEDQDQWIEQTKLICDDIEFSCGSITQFKVSILENLPISNRGRLLRRFLAFRFLFGSNSTFSQEKDILFVTNPEIIKLLPNLFRDSLTIFKIRDETNYADLYNYVVFLDYALDDESQLRKAKDTVEEIYNKLTYLHGRIVDMRAAFMERTKAKDLIQRLYMRLYYITNYRRGKVQKSILSYSPKSNQLDVDKEEN